MIRSEMLCPSWPQKPLGEVVDFLDHHRRPITARDRVSGPYPYYGANGQQDSVADYMFDEPLILMAEDGGYFGDPDRTIAYRVDGKCWVNNHAHVLRPKDGVDIGFLCRQLEKYDVTRFIKGATRQKLNKSNASEIPIILPPLAEQKRIAAILDKADAIRRKRRHAIQLADEFLRSVFLDMFGDPITNSKKWEKGHIQDLCEEIVDCPHATPKYAAGQTDFACIRSSDIQNGYMDWSSTKYVEEAEYKERIKRLEPAANDVIYCREGARFGNAARIPRRKTICLGQRMMLFRSNHMFATAEFIWALLNSDSIYQQAVQKIGGSASPHINVGDIKRFSIIIPPLRIQQKYSIVVKKLDVMKEKYQSFSLISDQIFNSITQRAFRGEL
jgi:type I restriction enzyme S subunit